MQVLVTYASRYGATREIGEHIAAALRRDGLSVTACAVNEAQNLHNYDAAVIGSAIYFARWLGPARAFVRTNRVALAQRPVWLFSSGPVGNQKTDPKGRDLCEASEPAEIPALCNSIRPRGHRVFYGAMQPKRLTWLHRMLSALPPMQSSGLFTEGDFREWDEVDRWASEIARELQRTPNILYEAPTLTP
jgi:menaquinone-dependent protoporphyrinogen oxidase